MNNVSLGRAEVMTDGRDEGRSWSPVPAEHAMDVAGRAADDGAQRGLGDSSFAQVPVEGLAPVPADLATRRS